MELPKAEKRRIVETESYKIDGLTLASIITCFLMGMYMIGQIVRWWLT